jgi:hypothetical protein
MGATTVDHNIEEHRLVPIRLAADTIVDGVGFTIHGATVDLTLTGLWSVRWSWFTP